VTVAGWSGRLEEAAAHDGAAMQATLGALHHELQRRAAREELALQPPAWTPLLGWAALALLALGAATRGWAVALGAGVCGVAWWMARQALAGRRARQRAVAGAAHARALHQLRAVLEEWSALRRDRLEGRDRLPAARDRLRRTLG
jgi:hypothetical protein